MLAPSPAGRTVLRLVLDHYRPPIARPLSTSGTRGARAEKVAHAQQIIHDRRQRRAIQEDVVKLSSRDEIDRREVAPRIALSPSTWVNVDLSGPSAKWGGESWVPGKGTIKQYKDLRESQAGKRGLRAASIRRMEEKGRKRGDKRAREGYPRQYSTQQASDETTRPGPNRRARRAHLKQEYERRTAALSMQEGTEMEIEDNELQQERRARAATGDPDEIQDPGPCTALLIVPSRAHVRHHRDRR